MWKKDTTRCLDIVRSLPIVPCFPHTSSPRILRPIIYLDKAKLQAKSKNPIKLSPTSFSHEKYSPFIR